MLPGATTFATSSTGSTPRNTKPRRKVVSTRTRKWFNIGTTVWAIALLVAAIIYLTATPAFADDGWDCMLVCSTACNENDGCARYYEGGWGCGVECRDGETYTVICEM